MKPSLRTTDRRERAYPPLRRSSSKATTRPISLLALAGMTIAFVGCSAIGPREPVGSAGSFETVLSSGQFQQLCYFQTFDARIDEMSIERLEAECGCDLKDREPLAFRSSAILIEQGRIHAKAMSWSELNYRGGVEGWRTERSFCFPRERVHVAGSAFSIE